MELSYVENRIIFETIVGSQAYGINNKDSDVDKSGVMIPGIEYFYGLDRVEQFNGYPDEDKTIYEIRKAIRLISDNNPNMMDLLWVPDRCVLKMTDYWQKIMDNRDLFVSKRCRYTFSGYAYAQLSRIKTHRKFLLDPPKSPPTREELGLPAVPIFPTSQLKGVCFAAMEFLIEEEKQNFIDELDGIYGDYVVPLLARFLRPEERGIAMEWLQMGIKSQANAFQSVGTQYIKDEYIDMAHKELSYYNACKEYARYQDWKKARNKNRAPLEEKFGYDSKHAAHLIRLLNMGEEILKTGRVNVDRTNIDAEELKAIRAGAWAYDKVEQYASDKDAEFDALYKTSTLPKSVDIVNIGKLCVEVVDQYHKKHS
jgi:predicted nucleotidyltransferase